MAAWDATNVADGSGGVVDADRHRPPAALPGPDDSAGHRRREGRDHQAGRDRRVGHTGPLRGVRSWPSAPSEVGARIAFEGIDFGVAGRDVAVGGQQLSVRGLAGDYDDIFLPLHGAHHGAATPRSRSPRSRRSSAEASGDSIRDVLRAGLAAATLTGTAGDRAAFADDPRRRGPQPARHAGVARRLDRRLHLHHASSVWWRSSGTSRRRRCSRMLESVLDHVVVTRNSSPTLDLARASSAQAAVEVFGAGRVHRRRLTAGRGRPRPWLID